MTPRTLLQEDTGMSCFRTNVLYARIYDSRIQLIMEQKQTTVQIKRCWQVRHIVLYSNKYQHRSPPSAPQLLNSEKGVWVWRTSSVRYYPVSDHLRHNHEKCFVSCLAFQLVFGLKCFKLLSCWATGTINSQKYWFSEEQKELRAKRQLQHAPTVRKK